MDVRWVVRLEDGTEEDRDNQAHAELDLPENAVYGVYVTNKPVESHFIQVLPEEVDTEGEDVLELDQDEAELVEVGQS